MNGEAREPGSDGAERATRLCAKYAALGAASVLLLSLAGCASIGVAPQGVRLARLRSSPSYHQDHFENAEPTHLITGGLGRVIQEMIFGNREMRVPVCILPVDAGAREALRVAAPSGLRITWLGHSTTLIEIDGLVVLTDPVWSDRASPFDWVGPVRMHPVPLPLEALPRIDVVLISHDHYDHLDMPTIRALAPRGVTFHVGLGVGEHLEAWGVPAAQIVEHDWWEETALPGGVRVISTPARHLSGRWLGRDATTLWTSWVLAGPRHRVYFSGDGGPSEGFSKVGEAFGPFDVALMEIGQWNPSWNQVHLGPVNAVTAFKALRARHLLPIHWSTFELALHAWSEPAETLSQETEREGISLLTPRLAQPVEPERDPPRERWWRAYPPMRMHCPRGTDLPRVSFDHWPM